MSNPRENDIPAFPRSYQADGHNGMWLRDWFAGQALAGIMAADVEITGKDLPEAHQRAALICYSAADAMLTARDSKDPM